MKTKKVVATEAKANEAKIEAEKLMAKAKEMAEIAKKAAKEAKEAAKKAKALTSRPIRLARFVAMIQEDGQEATTLAKGDVHYCVEKAAIDEALHQREQDEEPRTIIIYKVKKDPDSPKNDLPGSYTEVSRVYLDPETKQVVID